MPNIWQTVLSFAAINLQISFGRLLNSNTTVPLELHVICLNVDLSVLLSLNTYAKGYRLIASRQNLIFINTTGILSMFSIIKKNKNVENITLALNFFQEYDLKPKLGERSQQKCFLVPELQLNFYCRGFCLISQLHRDFVAVLILFQTLLSSFCSQKSAFPVV